MRKISKVSIFVVLLVGMISIFSSCGLFDFETDTNKVDIAECEISLSQDIFEYTGEEIKPEITVKYNDKTLVLNSDYEVDYQDNIQIGTAKIIVKGIGKYTGEKTLEFEIADHVYTYVFKSDIEGFEYEGALIQVVTDKSQVVFPTMTLAGYKFVYWYCKPDVVINVDTKENLPEEGGEIWAYFELEEYKITYHLDGGENNQLNVGTFTIKDDVTLYNPTRGEDIFAGWYLDGEYTQRIEKITAGEYSADLELFARFVTYDYKKITYIVPDGVDFTSYDYVLPNTKLESPYVLSQDKTQELVWYVDQEYTTKYVFRKMPYEDITVYARWEDVLNSGFLDSLPDGSIDSYNELLDYIEYIGFYNIQQNQSQEVNVTYVSGKSQINQEIAKAAKEATYPRVGSLIYVSGNSTVTIYLEEDLSDKIATVTGTQKEDYYPQYGDIMYNPQSSRSDDYDDFAINYVQNTYECATSDQLFYVLSHGYRPLPVEGSVAQSIYEQFKDIMRRICDDDMSDFEKVTNIYQWLVLNVYYDNFVASAEANSDEYYSYKAFYLEGVLEGSAVCDGISKAFSVMCAIEGIDCVRVTGQQANANVGHAWNKIQIMGDWYLSDATWGNRNLENDVNGTIEYYEFLSYEYMLFSDYTRTYEDGYISNNYTYYQTNDEYTSIDLYDSFDLQVEGRQIDLLINDAEELSYLLLYAYEIYPDEKGCILNFVIENNMNVKELIQSAYANLKKLSFTIIPYGYDFAFIQGTNLGNDIYLKGSSVFIAFE